MKEFKKILRENDMTAKEFSEEIGISYSGYRSAVSRGVPTWIKSFLLGYKLGKK